jgi:hypothetical protein
MNDTYLNPRLQKLLDHGITPLDIMHGELKNIMYELEQELENVSGVQDQPQYQYLIGQLDMCGILYGLTYQLSFAIGDNNG